MNSPTSILFTCFLLVLGWAFPASSNQLPSNMTGVYGKLSDIDKGCDAFSQVLMVNQSNVIAIRPLDVAVHVMVGDTVWRDNKLILKRSAGQRVLENFDGMERCNDAPSKIATFFGEALALFRVQDRINQQCRHGAARQCLLAVMDFLDVSRDNRLSEAEIARGMRALSFFWAYEGLVGKNIASGQRLFPSNAWIDVSELYAVSFAVTLSTPFITGSLIKAHDFSGDGMITIDELLQDRERMSMDQLRTTIGAQLGSDGIRGILNSLPSMLQTLSQGLGAGMFGLR